MHIFLCWVAAYGACEFPYLHEFFLNGEPRNRQEKETVTGVEQCYLFFSGMFLFCWAHWTAFFFIEGSGDEGGDEGEEEREMEERLEKGVDGVRAEKWKDEWSRSLIWYFVWKRDIGSASCP